MAEPFDPTKIQFAVKPPIGTNPAESELSRYLQSALNRLIKAGLTEDGRYGPKTRQAVKNYQTVNALPVTGLVDRWTWYRIDWQVYDGWTPASPTLTTHKPGCAVQCSAIVKGRNYHTGLPVDVRGLTREAKRLFDVTNHYAPVDFRRNIAVDRNARGTRRLSRHALGLANDDMTDLDKDRVLEHDEIVQCNIIADLIIARTQGWPTEYAVIMGDRVPFIGPDRLATTVWGQHRLDGVWHFPLPAGGGGRVDWSWTPPRCAWKPLTANIHYNHLHFDVAPGAPL